MPFAMRAASRGRGKQRPYEGKIAAEMLQSLAPAEAVP